MSDHLKNPWEIEAWVENFPKFNGKVLVIGSGGREHAIAWKLAQSDKAEEILVFPGNPGTSTKGKIKNAEIDTNPNDPGYINALLEFAKENDIWLVVVGPEQPLVDWIVDKFNEAWIRIFWPSKEAAELEWSKDFTKKVCDKYKIPTADYKTFEETEIEKAKQYVRDNQKFPTPMVIKEDGLAAGKWVTIAQNQKEADDAIDKALKKEWSKVVIEEFLEGKEVSMIFMVDKNRNIIPMISSQDHKKRNDWDEWKNTWGMGAYAPVFHIMTPELEEEIMEKIIRPTVDWMSKEGKPFTGFLYAWLMIGDDWELNLLEYNVRFGDPETQVVLPLLDSDFLEMCLAWAEWNLDTIQDVQWSTKKAITVVLAAKSYPESWDKNTSINLPDEIADDIIIFHAGTAKNEVGQLVTNGGRILAVTAIADTMKEASKKIYAIIEEIEELNSWLFHYRTDIWKSAIDAERGDAKK
jgi:phosphoribosylamine--glycine ligase